MSLYDGIKDVANVVRKADNIELYQQLLDLGQIALDMQDQIRELKQENYELKRCRENEQQIERHIETYITLKNDESKLKYCSVCWDRERKLIQMTPFDDRKAYFCFVCKSKVYL